MRNFLVEAVLFSTGGKPGAWEVTIFFCKSVTSTRWLEYPFLPSNTLGLIGQRSMYPLLKNIRKSLIVDGRFKNLTFLFFSNLLALRRSISKLENFLCVSYISFDHIFSRYGIPSFENFL